MKHEVAGELAMVAVPCGEAELPGVRTVRIAPDGRIESTNGTIIIDAEGAGQIVDEYRRHGVDLPIDVEHETLSDRRAPAAGWIRKLWYEPGLGLMAHVEWTIEGREHIRAGRYRYLSPVLIVNKDTHRATALHSAAIVTKPAIPRMERLAASSRQLIRETFAMAEQATEGQTVRTPELVLGEIAGVLMVESKGTVLETLEAVLDKLKTLVGDEDDDAAAIAASVRDRLGLDIRASRDEVLVALSVATANSGAMCELADMRRSESERIAHERVDKYVKNGVLLETDKPAMVAAIALAAENPDRFEALMANAVPIVPQGRLAAPSKSQVRRWSVIGKAQQEWESGEGRLKSLTSCKAFVNNALREAGLAVLADDELKDVPAEA